MIQLTTLCLSFFFSGFPDKLRSFPCKAHPLPSLKKQKNANDFVEIGVEKDKFECQWHMIGSKWTNFFFFKKQIHHRSLLRASTAVELKI